MSILAGCHYDPGGCLCVPAPEWTWGLFRRPVRERREHQLGITGVGAPGEHCVGGPLDRYSTASRWEMRWRSNSPGAERILSGRSGAGGHESTPTRTRETCFAVGLADEPPVERANSDVPDKTLDMAQGRFVCSPRNHSLFTQDTAQPAGLSGAVIFRTEPGRRVFTPKADPWRGTALHAGDGDVSSVDARREQDVIRFFKFPFRCRWRAIVISVSDHSF